MTGGIDNQGAEVVIERAAVPREGRVGKSRELADLIRGPGQKTPVSRIVMVHFRIGFQRAWVIKFRVEGNREEVPVGGPLASELSFFEASSKFFESRGQ